jgi:hypothetical protein
VEITVAALAEDDIMENNDSFGRGRVGRSGIWRGCRGLRGEKRRRREGEKGDEAATRFQKRHRH